MVAVCGGNVFAMVAMEDAVASQKSAQALKTNAQALLAQLKVQAHHTPGTCVPQRLITERT